MASILANINLRLAYIALDLVKVLSKKIYKAKQSEKLTIIPKLVLTHHSSRKENRTNKNIKHPYRWFHVFMLTKPQQLEATT